VRHEDVIDNQETRVREMLDCYPATGIAWIKLHNDPVVLGGPIGTNAQLALAVA
jgi:hypothetical protein